MWLQTVKLLFFLFVVLGVHACSTTSFDKKAFTQSEVRSIGIVIGSGARALLYSIGPWIKEEVFAPLPADIEDELNQKVLRTLNSALAGKGYNVVHLKTVHIEWNLYSNISDSPQSYNNLLWKYRIEPQQQKVDAILFVEYLLQPKGPWLTEARLKQLTLNAFEVTYAKVKFWVYDMRKDKRLYFALNQKGFDQVLSHVTPDAALNDILILADIPYTQGKENILEK